MVPKLNMEKWIIVWSVWKLGEHKVAKDIEVKSMRTGNHVRLVH